MTYEYIERDFGFPHIIQDINIKLQRNYRNKSMEKVIGEVESITVKDISLALVPSVEEFKEIQVFIHRLAVTFVGEEKGRFINLATFHSDDIFSQEYEAYLPNDFDVIYDEIGVKIESKYVLEDEHEELLSYLKKVRFYSVIDQEFKDRIIQAFYQIGYEPEIALPNEE